MEKRFGYVLMFLLLFTVKTHAQLGVTYYTANIIAVNTGKTHKINGELKIFAVKPIEDLPLELDVYYNFNLKDFYRFSIGAGFRANVFTGESAAFTLPIKFEVIPFKQFKNVSFLYEMAPEFYFNDDIVGLRNLLGLRYTFLK